MRSGQLCWTTNCLTLSPSHFMRNWCAVSSAGWGPALNPLAHTGLQSRPLWSELKSEIRTISDHMLHTSMSCVLKHVLANEYIMFLGQLHTIHTLLVLEKKRQWMWTCSCNLNIHLVTENVEEFNNVKLKYYVFKQIMHHYDHLYVRVWTNTNKIIVTTSLVLFKGVGTTLN